MRINEQFVDPRTTRSLWSDTYERNVSDALEAQNDIVARIAAGVAGALGVAASDSGLTYTTAQLITQGGTGDFTYSDIQD